MRPQFRLNLQCRRAPTLDHDYQKRLSEGNAQKRISFLVLPATADEDVLLVVNELSDRPERAWRLRQFKVVRSRFIHVLELKTCNLVWQRMPAGVFAQLFANLLIKFAHLLYRFFFVVLHYLVHLARKLYFAL